jgi:hypothetical integral membrane protein (TIGR02206 family)
LNFQDTSSPFIPFSMVHWLAIFAIICLFGLLSNWVRYKSEKVQLKVAILMSIIPFLCVILRVLLVTWEDNFTVEEELPLHLCRVSAIVFPFAILYKWHKIINVLFFYCLVFTSLALITPDLQYNPPHYSFFFYFILHGTLALMPIYMVKILKIIPQKADIWNAFIWGNGYMVFTFIINKALNSNYLYTSKKPPPGTLFDYLGPWPWYLLVINIGAMVLFYLIWLPLKKSK